MLKLVTFLNSDKSNPWIATSHRIFNVNIQTMLFTKHDVAQMLCGATGIDGTEDPSMYEPYLFTIFKFKTHLINGHGVIFFKELIAAIRNRIINKRIDEIYYIYSDGYEDYELTNDSLLVHIPNRYKSITIEMARKY